MLGNLKIKRALISVYDKTGLLELVEVLNQFNIEIFSTGGTFDFLSQKFNTIKNLSEITGITSLLDGRVKTLHPLVHSAILAKKDSEKHLDELKAAGIEPFDLVIINFYPFENVINNQNLSEDEIIEYIDIGGPTLVRSAAKNFNSVVIISSINQYPGLIEELKNNSGKININLRRQFAAEAFQNIVKYDIAISNYFNQDKVMNISLNLEKDLRYGENPHQSAKLYGDFFKSFQQLHGKELSYNNILDITSAAELVFEFDKIACAIVKHNSPCGVAIGNSIKEAYEKALKCDPVSAFGGIVAFNKSVNAEIANQLNKIFLEVIVAPDFDQEALEILKSKKDRRIIKVNDNFKSIKSFLHTYELKSVPGAILIQSKDDCVLVNDFLEFVTVSQPDQREIDDLKFAFTVSKYVKSNAIVFAKNGMTLGIGGGQTSRVDSVKIALMKAKEFNHDLDDSVVASDGFFPFSDSIEIAASAGAKAFIQPGGSIRDSEVIQFANDNKLKIVLTRIRHFKH